MKISVTGKGGVGKTLVTGVLSNFFAKKGFKVLAIDADPSPNLALSLGIPIEQASKIMPVSENSGLIEQKTRTKIEGVYRLSFRIDDIIENFAVRSPNGVSLLVMGTVRSAGAGCTCPANAVIRSLLRHLLVERDEVVIMDMEAGIEHMGRGTAKQVEVMLIVTESSLKSMETGKRIYNLGREAGIEKAFLVGNKVKDANEGKVIERFASSNGIPLFELIPYDEEVWKADMRGEPPNSQTKISKSVSIIQNIGEKLIEQYSITD